MRRFGTFALLLLAISLSSRLGAAEKDVASDRERAETVSFVALEKAVDFMATCLDNDDYDSFARAFIGPPGVKYVAPRHLFTALQKRHKEKSLRELYNGKQFPGKDQSFKLGGHNKELGHIHIDFAKHDKKWYIQTIWMCR